MPRAKIRKQKPGKRERALLRAAQQQQNLSTSNIDIPSRSSSLPATPVVVSTLYARKIQAITSLLRELSNEVTSVFEFCHQQGFDLSSLDSGLHSTEQPKYHMILEIRNKLEIMSHRFSRVRNNLQPFPFISAERILDKSSCQLELAHYETLTTQTKLFDASVILRLIHDRVTLKGIGNVQILNPAILSSEAEMYFNYDTAKVVLPCYEDGRWQLFCINIPEAIFIFVDPLHHFLPEIEEKVMRKLTVNCPSLARFTRQHARSCPFQRDLYSCGPNVVMCARLFLEDSSSFLFSESNLQLRNKFVLEIFNGKYPNLFSFLQTVLLRYEALFLKTWYNIFIGQIANTTDIVTAWARNETRLLEQCNQEYNFLRPALNSVSCSSEMKTQLFTLGLEPAGQFSLPNFRLLILTVVEHLEE